MAEEMEGVKINTIEATKGDKKATITYDFGGSVEAAIEKFGSNVVYANFVRSAVITAQAGMRRMLVAGKSQEEIATKMADWKPGVPMEKSVDVLGAAQKLLANMSDDEKQAFIDKLLAGE